MLASVRDRLIFGRGQHRMVERSVMWHRFGEKLVVSVLRIRFETGLLQLATHEVVGSLLLTVELVFLVLRHLRQNLMMGTDHTTAT